MNGEVQQVVVAQEAIEDFGSEYQRRRHRDAGSREAARDAALPQDVANESQATRFTAERAAANLEKEGFVGLECGGIEFADQGLTLLAAILGDRIDQVTTQIFEATEVGHCARAQLLRQCELGTGHEPMGEVITLP